MQTNINHKAMFPTVKNNDLSLQDKLSEFELLLDCNNQLIGLLQDVECGYIKADKGLIHYMQALLQKHIEEEFSYLSAFILNDEKNAEFTQSKGGENAN